MQKQVKKIIAADYHRNGVGGQGFGVVVFVPHKDVGAEGNMVGVVFPERGHVAVLDIDMLADGIVAFGKNSWRGDNFEDELIAALEAADSSPYPEPEDEPEEKDYEVQVVIHEYVAVTVKARNEAEAVEKAEQEAVGLGEASEAQGQDIEIVMVNEV